MLHTEGTKWLTADGQQPALRGVNLGNYLIQEFWMMGQETKAVDDQCKLEAVLDQRFGYAERQRCMGCFATTGSRRATGTCCRR
jgi:glucan 1,3-beta-glucosidase